MKCVDDFRLSLGKKEIVPIVVGGMGVDISTAELALEAARLGGIGHISDAMIADVCDKRFKTTFIKDKTKFYKLNIPNSDKSIVKFDLGLNELPVGFAFAHRNRDRSRWPGWRSLARIGGHPGAACRILQIPLLVSPDGMTRYTRSPFYLALTRVTPKQRPQSRSCMCFQDVQLLLPQIPKG